MADDLLNRPRPGRRRRDGLAAGPEKTYVVESAERVLDLLLYLSGQGGAHTVSELSRGLQLSFSRTYRLAATLEGKGFLERDPATRRYSVGPRAFEVGVQYLRGNTLLAQARPYLERLVAESQETAFLAIRDGAEVVYIDRVDSPQVVRFQTAIGSRAPWGCVAAGRALVSAEPAAVIDELLRGDLGACADGRGPDLARLSHELELVRQRGYATNFGEWHTDVAAIAAPLRDARGRPRAALVLGAPLARTSVERAAALGQLLVDTADLARLAIA